MVSARLRELLVAGLDELMVSLVPVPDSVENEQQIYYFTNQRLSFITSLIKDTTHRTPPIDCSRLLDLLLDSTPLREQI
jgi:hypothetical protein